jgi:hypothetical protein
MATTSTCPQPSELQKLATGNLPPLDMESMVQHLESCDGCLARVQALPSADTLLDLLAQARTLTDGPEEPIVTRLIARLKELGKTPAPAAAAQKLLTLACSSCGKKLKVKADLAGKKVKCPGCASLVPVPQVVAPAPKVGEQKTDVPEASRDASDLKTVLPASEATGTDAAAAQPAKPDATQSLPENGMESELWDFLAPPERPDEIGRLGAYRVLKVLGAGGMGVVFRAEDPHLERPVALKAMLPALAASPSAKKRFLREAKAAAALKHDHVVAIYQVSEDRGAPFIAMEFLEGEPLDKCLERESQLPLVDTLRIGREIAEGLAAAHDKGLIHRDIKPANIWLEKQTSRARKEAGQRKPGRIRFLTGAARTGASRFSTSASPAPPRRKPA